jgi:uncharacterized protein
MKQEYNRVLEKVVVAKQTLLAWSNQCESWMLTRNKDFDPGHRIDHLHRVLKNAITLALAEQADLSIIVPSAWFHDCASVEKNSTQRSQASRLSATMATDLLQNWDYPAHYLPHIGHAIEAHSFSAGISAQSIEAKVLQDADRLDALGSIGIARAIMVGATFDSCLYSSKEPFATTRSLDEKHFIVDHFYTKLLTLYRTFQTQSGTNEAKKRTQTMHHFLKTLAAEIGCSIPSQHTIDKAATIS